MTFKAGADENANGEGERKEKSGKVPQPVSCSSQQTYPLIII